MTVFDREQNERFFQGQLSKQSLEFQMDLIKAKSDRLMRDEQVYRKVSEMIGYGFYYENFKDGSSFLVGDWETIFGFKQERYENDIDFLKNIKDYENGQIIKSITVDEDTLYQEFRFSIQGKETWVSNTLWTKREEGRTTERISCFRNITSFKRQNEELEFLAFYDMVTGLYNRNYFVKELNDILVAERTEKTYNTISLLCIKINDFKKINEGMGMVVGDEVLQEVGFRLQEFMETDMLVGRIEGGEFCIAIYDASGARSVERIHSQIIEKMKEPIRIYQHEPIQISLSFGVAEYPEAGSSAIELIRNAQIVMKNSINKRGNLSYYDYRIVNEFMEKLKLERRLKEAANGMTFELYFQPQFDVNTRKLRGAETLLRWRNEDGTFVPNNKYIPIAEQTGEIIRIGKWVLRTAISLLAKWEEEFAFDGVLSINASALQLRQDDFVPYLIGLIEEYQISPGNLEIEITESVLMEDMEGIISKFKILRGYGIKVSLDDFGTGFSSLTYLKDLPIDTLKIDKSFIDSVTTDDSTNIITQSVVKMVKQLGLETVAEGVETEEQYAFLEKIQCDNIQGFLMGKPMPETQFCEIYKNAAGLT